MNSLISLVSYSHSNKQGDFAALLAAAAAELAPTLLFASREGYLRWVAQWKDSYRRLSLRIRLEKLEARKPVRPEKIICCETQIARLKALLTVPDPLGSPELPLPALPQVWTPVAPGVRRARVMLALRQAGKIAAAQAARV